VSPVQRAVRAFVRALVWAAGMAVVYVWLAWCGGVL